MAATLGSTPPLDGNLPQVPGYRVLGGLPAGGPAPRYRAVIDGADPRELTITLVPRELVARSLALPKIAESLRRLHCGAVERVLDLGVLPSGALFLVTPRRSGRALSTLLGAPAPLDAATVTSIARQACAGLAAAHGEGVVHGALTSASLFFSGGALDDLQIIDFAIPGADPAGAPSPEQRAGGPADARSDVYALGAVIFEALCGVRPPVAGTSSPAPTRLEPRSGGAPLPASLEALVIRCLSIDPAQRFESAQALADALEATSVERQHAPHAPTAPFRSGQAAAAAASAASAASSQALATKLPPGTVLGAYRLVDLLGEGGMGIVYLAEHVRLGRRVALKLLRSEFASDPQAVSRFFAEARAVNQICHENIVEITDFIENPAGDNYYIMEFLPGVNLEQLVRSDGPLPLPRSLGIAVQVCSALTVVHDAGIVHRDLKPENIFLTERGGQRDFVKLLDFGIAKLGKHDTAVSTHETGVGMIVGTPDYMSTEQASGVPVDQRSDIYALGIILYELLAGRNPFAGDNFGEMLVNRLSKTPPPPSVDCAQAVPRELDELILQCILSSRDARPQTVREVETRLRAIAVAHACELETFVEQARPARGRRPRLVLAAAGALALVGVGALLAHRSQPEGGTIARSSLATPLPTAAAAPMHAATDAAAGHSDDAARAPANETVTGTLPVELHPPAKSKASHGKKRLDGPSRHAVIDAFQEHKR